MKRLLTAGVIIAALFLHETGQAKPIETLSQNLFMTAESIDAGMTQSGIHFTAGEGYQSFYPSFRFGLGGSLEAGVRVGATNADVGPEDKLALLVGGDVKFQLIKQTEGIPLDMAIDLGFDNHFLSGNNLSELTFSALFSRSFPLIDRGYKITPYGGLEFSSLYGSYVSERETDFYALAGLEWKLTQKSMFIMEFKAGDNMAGGIGIRFEY